MSNRRRSKEIIRKLDILPRNKNSLHVKEREREFLFEKIRVPDSILEDPPLLLSDGEDFIQYHLPGFPQMFDESNYDEDFMSKFCSVEEIQAGIEKLKESSLKRPDKKKLPRKNLRLEKELEDIFEKRCTTGSSVVDPDSVEIPDLEEYEIMLGTEIFEKQEKLEHLLMLEYISNDLVDDLIELVIQNEEESDLDETIDQLVERYLDAEVITGGVQNSSLPNEDEAKEDVSGEKSVLVQKDLNLHCHESHENHEEVGSIENDNLSELHEPETNHDVLENEGCEDKEDDGVQVATAIKTVEDEDTEAETITDEIIETENKIIANELKKQHSHESVENQGNVPILDQNQEDNSKENESDIQDNLEIIETVMEDNEENEVEIQNEPENTETVSNDTEENEVGGIEIQGKAENIETVTNDTEEYENGEGEFQNEKECTGTVQNENEDLEINGPLDNIEINDHKNIETKESEISDDIGKGDGSRDEKWIETAVQEIKVSDSIVESQDEVAIIVEHPLLYNVGNIETELEYVPETSIKPFIKKPSAKKLKLSRINLNKIANKSRSISLFDTYNHKSVPFRKPFIPQISSKTSKLCRQGGSDQLNTSLNNSKSSINSYMRSSKPMTSTPMRPSESAGSFMTSTPKNSMNRSVDSSAFLTSTPIKSVPKASNQSPSNLIGVKTFGSNSSNSPKPNTLMGSSSLYGLSRSTTGTPSWLLNHSVDSSTMQTSKSSTSSFKTNAQKRTSINQGLMTNKSLFRLNNTTDLSAIAFKAPKSSFDRPLKSPVSTPTKSKISSLWSMNNSTELSARPSNVPRVTNMFKPSTPSRSPSAETFSVGAGITLRPLKSLEPEQKVKKIRNSPKIDPLQLVKNFQDERQFQTIASKKDESLDQSWMKPTIQGGPAFRTNTAAEERDSGFQDCHNQAKVHKIGQGDSQSDFFWSHGRGHSFNFHDQDEDNERGPGPAFMINIEDDGDSKFSMFDFKTNQFNF